MNDLIPSTYNWVSGYNWQNFRSKTFCFLLYDEWSDLDEILMLLKTSVHEFLAISPCHDSDLKKDGTLDKPHYHGIISFKNQIWAYSFCRKFHITVRPEALKNKFGNRTGAILYLTHSDDNSKQSGKHLYSFEDIYTDCPEEVFAIYNSPVVFKADLIDENKFLLNIDYMIQNNMFSSELLIASYCISNGYGALFQKYKYQIHSDFCSCKARLREKNKNKNCEV